MIIRRSNIMATWLRVVFFGIKYRPRNNWRRI